MTDDKLRCCRRCINWFEWDEECLIHGCHKDPDDSCEDYEFMGKVMYPTKRCNDCRHATDIEKDLLGRDLITCGCEECRYEKVEGDE